MSKQFIPPIIEDMISKIKDPSTPSFNRDNYAQVLERTREAIALALNNYETQKRWKKENK